jgi:hypothetical protein
MIHSASRLSAPFTGLARGGLALLIAVAALLVANCAPSQSIKPMVDFSTIDSIQLIRSPAPRIKAPDPQMLACGSGTGGLLLGGLGFLADMAISRGLPEGSSFSWLTFAGAAVGATAGFAIAEGMRVNEVKMDSVGLDVSKMVLTEFVRRAESIPGWPRMVVHDSVFRKGARRPDGLVLEMGICDLAMGPTRGVTLAAVATLFDQGRNVLWQRAAKYNSQDIGHTPPTLPSGFSNAPVDQSYYLLSLTSFYRRELSAGASYVATVMASKPPSAQ